MPLNFDDLVPGGGNGSVQPKPVTFDDLIPAARAPSKAYSGGILPFSIDEQGNKSFDSDAGILGSIKRAVMLPGEVMAGEVDPMSQEGLGRSLEAASVFLPMSPAAGTGKAISALSPKPVSTGMEAAGAASRLGVDLPRAVASDSAIVQQGGKVLSNIPIGGTPLRTALKQAIDQLGEAAGRVQAGYGAGNIANAGAAARQGISDYATKTLAGKVKSAYDNVDSLITQNVTTPLSATAKVAADISARRANAALPESGSVKLIQHAINQKDGLNYQGIKDLRTNIGEMLDNPQSITASGFSEGELKRIYGGLTDDLKSAVVRAGGEKASRAFGEANQLAAKTSREREALQKVLGRDVSDERLFDRITAMAGSSSRADRISMLRVKKAVSPETWDELASGVISNLGRDKDGAFSPDRFLTGYGKLSNEGKNALFGNQKELASSLDDIAAVSRQFKKLNDYANPSGTGQTAAGFGYLTGVFLEPTSVVSSLVGARVMSSMLSKPVSAKALAAYSKAYERQAIAPTATSTQTLQNTARVLAAAIGNEVGDKTVAQQVFPAISSLRQVPADQRDENGGRPEGQDKRVGNQPRMFLPNET